MAAYQYTALDNSGKSKKGVLQADTAKLARLQLREQGLTPLTVDIVDQTTVRTNKKFSFLKPRVSVAELSLITRQFATMLSAGIHSLRAMES